MKPFVSGAGWKLYHGDMVRVLATFPPDYFDAIVTDPPYLLAFMGSDWDSVPGGDPQKMQEQFRRWFTAALRVLKPGGHILAFGGTRTYHRLAAGIEDAGAEIRDSIHWLYGSGFPKSYNVSKAIDAAAGAEREIVGVSSVTGVRNDKWSAGAGLPGQTAPVNHITAPATPEAARWSGWGTALAPGHEPIVLARKPFKGTIAGNVRLRGTGVINIDGCREASGPSQGGATSGRWPANVVLTHSADCRQVGSRSVASSCKAEHVGMGREGQHTNGIYGAKASKVTSGYADADGTETIAAWECADDCPVAGLEAQQNGASRFFPVTAWHADYDLPFMYQSKPARSERGKGLKHLSPTAGHDAVKRKAGTAGLDNPRAGAGRTASTVANFHPTVKPLDLMRWCVRLVCPRGGRVLDPFAGSGTTLAAGLMEGMHVTGIELTEEYLPLIEGRCNAWDSLQGRLLRTADTAASPGPPEIP